MADILRRPHDIKQGDLIIEVKNPDGTGITLGNHAVEVITAYAPTVPNGPWMIVCKGLVTITMAPNGRAKLAE
jgi:hypothetical protein